MRYWLNTAPLEMEHVERVEIDGQDETELYRTRVESKFWYLYNDLVEPSNPDPFNDSPGKQPKV